MKTERLLQCMALPLLNGIGHVRAKHLLSSVDDISEIFESPLSRLSRNSGISFRVLNSMKREQALEQAKSLLRFHEQNGVQSIFIQDAAYPRRLKQSYDAPLMLYLKGSIDLNDHHFVSVVGTRNATSYGKKVCAELVESFKGKDIVVVSGLAYGIDVYTHQECLKQEVPTIGVLGHGLDRIYPRVHQSIAKRMIEQGGLLTEFLPETNPDRENFPKRNRIVAGMSDATIVVESKQKGGSLITADMANDCNRDVFAVPGSIYQEQSMGCNRLISENKAHLYLGPDAFLKTMNWDTPLKNASNQTRLHIGLNEVQQRIVDLLNEAGASHMDTLTTGCNLTSSETSVALFELEMAGLVQPLPGKRYVLAA